MDSSLVCLAAEAGVPPVAVRKQPSLFVWPHVSDCDDKVLTCAAISLQVQEVLVLVFSAGGQNLIFTLTSGPQLVLLITSH